MSKKTLSSIVKAAGLAAILAGTTGCGIAGNTIGMHQKSPYTAGFIGGMGSLADSQYAAKSANGERVKVDYVTLDFGEKGTYVGQAIFEGGRYYPDGYGKGTSKDGKIWEGYWSKGKWAGKTREEYDIKKGISSKD